MSPVRRIGKNLVFKALTEIIGRLLSFVFYVMLARWLGGEAFGAFSLLYSVTAMAVFLVDPGLNLYMIRQAPRDEKFIKESAGLFLGLKLSLSLLTVLVSVIYGAASGYGPLMIGLFALMGIQMAGFSLMEYTSAIFQAKEKMEVETFIMGVGKTGVTLIAIVAVALGAQLPGALVAMTIAQIVAVVWAVVYAAGRGIDIKPSFDNRRWKTFLVNSAPLAAISFFTIVFYRADVALAPFLGLELDRIGWYSAGVKILDVVLAAPTLAVAAAFPTLSGMAQTDYAKFRRWTGIGLIGLLAAGGIMGAVIIVFSTQITTLIFGEGFANSAGPLQWLMGAGVLMFLRHGLINALVLEGRSGVAAWMVAVAAAVNIVLNIFLIPAAGILGAAKAKLITDALLVQLAGAAWLKQKRDKLEV